MGEFEKLLEKSLEEAREIKKGEVIRCKVIKVDSRNVYVDVGYKLEGIIPREELPEAKEGDELKAVVIRIAKGGSPILSYRAYTEKRCVRFLKSAHEKGSFVSGKVIEKTQDGYVVDIDGVRAFMPMTEAKRRLREGSKVIVKITELRDTKDGLKVRVSQKEYLFEQEKKRKEKLLRQLKVGDTVE
ncbi:MAG: S1 RNA-binding domain-containing protein, partial [Aquificaceae bacterium]